jgi:hypothetical protein
MTRPGAEIVIDVVQDDPRLSVNWPPVAKPEDLPDLLFRAIHFVSTGQYGSTKASFGDFSLQGPEVETLRPLAPNLVRMVIDPKSKKYYGIARNAPVEVDLDRRTTKALDMGTDVPKLSHDVDITVDSKRNQLLVASGDPRGHLYACDLATGVWTVLADDPGVASLAYHRKHDCLYGVRTDGPGGRAGKPFLRKFTPSGEFLTDIPLSDVVVPASLHGSPTNGTQVLAVDEFVVIVAAPLGHHSSEWRGLIDTYIYLVEPKSGKVWITHKH